MEAYHLAIVLILGLVLCQTAANLRALPRLSTFGARRPQPAPSLSVLIPARDEAAHVQECIQAWRGQTLAPTELLLLDDQSSDDTGARAQAAMAGVGWARLLPGLPKPAGWSGKSFACHQLARAASGDILVFADADVSPGSGALAALAGAFADPGVEAVTVLPRHTAASAQGRHVLPLQGWALTCFCPLWLALRRPSPALATANGQLLALRRPAYQRAGSFGAVWQSLAEDVDLGRRLAAAGTGILVLDGTDLVTCRIPEALGAVWRANSKNLFAVLFRSHLFAAGALGFLLAGWVLPWAWLPLALGEPWPDLALVLLAIVLGLATRAVTARRFGYRLRDTWSHPLLVLVLAAMVGASMWVHARGRISWRGREYAPRRHPGAAWPEGDETLCPGEVARAKDGRGPGGLPPRRPLSRPAPPGAGRTRSPAAG